MVRFNAICQLTDTQKTVQRVLALSVAYDWWNGARDRSVSTGGFDMNFTGIACIPMLALIIGPAGLSACQLSQDGIVQHENDLSAAGFTVRLANTAERQAMLNRLPPNQFVVRTNGGITHYIYADPVACTCLYIGSPQAYDQYRSNQQLDYVGQQKMAALLYDDAAWDWGAWGPWGSLGPIYGPGPGW